MSRKIGEGDSLQLDKSVTSSSHIIIMAVFTSLPSSDHRCDSGGWLCVSSFGFWSRMRKQGCLDHVIVDPRWTIRTRRALSNPVNNDLIKCLQGKIYCNHECNSLFKSLKSHQILTNWHITNYVDVWGSWPTVIRARVYRAEDSGVAALMFPFLNNLYQAGCEIWSGNWKERKMLPHTTMDFSESRRLWMEARLPSRSRTLCNHQDTKSLQPLSLSHSCRHTPWDAIAYKYIWKCHDSIYFQSNNVLCGARFDFGTQFTSWDMNDMKLCHGWKPSW